MSVTVKTVEEATCDMCGQSCGKTDGDIYIQVNGGDGRDVGPAYITGTLRFTQPYGVSSGILCDQCKVTWLTKYLNVQCVY